MTLINTDNMPLLHNMSLQSSSLNSPVQNNSCTVESVSESKLNVYTCLKSAYGSTLEAKICLEVLCNLTNKTLEWQLPDQQLCGFLVSSNFSKCHSTWPTKNMNVLSVDVAATSVLKAPTSNRRG